MRRRKWILVLVVSFLLAQGVPGTAWAVTVSDIEGKVLCTCGCSDPSLGACTCGTADEMRAEIQKLIDEGKDEAEVISALRLVYGNDITNAPDKSGFDLTAWLMPFAVVFAGSVGVIKVMSTWVAKSRKAEQDDDTDDGGDDDTPDDDSSDDGKYDERIDEELKDFGW